MRKGTWSPADTHEKWTTREQPSPETSGHDGGGAADGVSAARTGIWFRTPDMRP